MKCHRILSLMCGFGVAVVCWAYDPQAVDEVRVEEVPTHSVDADAARAGAENLGADCATLPISLNEHLVGFNLDFASTVYAIDLDHDDDVDVVVGAGFDDLVAWYENTGGEPGSAPSFTQHIITESADFVRGVFAADINGDGDIDVLSASGFDDSIRWYESDGGNPPSFAPHVISDSARPCNPAQGDLLGPPPTDPGSRRRE